MHISRGHINPYYGDSRCFNKDTVRRTVSVMETMSVGHPIGNIGYIGYIYITNQHSACELI